VTFTSVLQILYAAGQAPTAPTLLSAVATEGTNAQLIGRIDGAPNQTVAVQVTSASGCFLGSLVGGAAVGGTINVQTDASGYFAVDVSGVNPGNFVSISLTGSPTSSCLISSRDNDSWPNAFPLDGSPVSVQDFIDAPDKARWYKFAITPGQTIRSCSQPARGLRPRGVQGHRTGIPRPVQARYRDDERSAQTDRGDRIGDLQPARVFRHHGQPARVLP
jgi:hypothetical protein